VRAHSAHVLRALLFPQFLRLLGLRDMFPQSAYFSVQLLRLPCRLL